MAADEVFINNQVIGVANYAGNRAKKPILVGCEDDGTIRQYGILVGLDPNNDERKLRTDANRMLRIRSFESNVGVDPSLVTNANTTLYTVPSSTLAKLAFYAVNVGATATVTLTINLVPSGGAAALGNRIFNALQFNANLPGQKFGPFNLEPGATVQGVASALNSIVIHWEVEHFSEGDTV